MTPRTPQQFKEMREEKMTLIMDVALEHFANEGYYRTTISHLARHAKMSKGLMYNYFESKEALLKAIIHRSVNEVYKYLDIDRDGYLSEEEFDFFVRKINVLLKEKRYFWRLLMQLLMQNDVKEQFLKAFPESDSLIHPGHEPGDNYYPSRILKMLTDYFVTKKVKIGRPSDPGSDFEMFLITLLGHAIRTIYSDSDDEEPNEKAINRIIELFK
jgi:AcrR family transcriptional regulator